MPGAVLRHRLLAVGLVVFVALSGWAAACTAVRSGAVAAASAPAAAPRSTGSKGSAPGDTVTAFGKLTGGATVLQLDPTTLADWKAAGVTVGPAGAATAVAGGAAVDLPVTSGYVESHSDHSFKPAFLLGSIEHSGSGLAFATTSTSVAATDLVFDLGGSVVYATIGATEDVPMFSLQRSHLQASRSGRTLRIGGARLALTPTGAAELDALFHTNAITAQTEVGTAGITATGQVSRYNYTEQTTEYPRLSGIAFSVDFTASARAAFRSVGVTPAPTGSASYHAARGSISFPITGGTVVVHPNRHGQPGSLAGVVLQQGSGLVLTQGSTSVTMTDLTWVPTTATVYASVNGGADDSAVFAVRRAKSRLTLAGGNLTLRGALVDLTTGAAAMLNSAFHTAQFQAGAGLGQLTVVASGG